MPPSDRLRLRRNPLRVAISAAPWAAVGYLASYLVVSVGLLGATLATVTATAALAITLAGIPLLVASCSVVRGCANVARWLLRQVLAEPVRGRYRQVDDPGILAQVRVRWRDPGTWRDLTYLIGMWPPLFVLAAIGLTAWVTVLAGVALPFWYWAPTGNVGIGYINLDGVRIHGVALGYFPHGPRGPGAVGLYVDTLPRALLAASAFLVLFLLVSYVLVAIARVHASVSRALLRAPADPLAAAREVLARPGPLGPLTDQLASGVLPGDH